MEFVGAVDLLGFGSATSSKLDSSWRRPAAALFSARRRILMERRPASPPSLSLLAESGRS
jgi:hypothetical protein